MGSAIDNLMTADAERDDLDFKQAFDPSLDGDWLELVKDIVAISNSGGGHIVIGCLNNGHPVGICPSLLIKTDPAVLVSKIHSYTGVQLKGVVVTGVPKDGKDLLVIKIPAAEYPMPFVKVGTYLADRASNKQKTAFNQGNLYFRHSAKSEPANAHDLRQFVESKIAEIKDFWLSGIRQVVEASPDSLIAVMPKELRLSSASDAPTIKITPELAQQLLMAPMVDQTHPYRQKEVISEFNRRMNGEHVINSHDLLCVRRAHNIHRDLKYCYNMNWSSPRYSEAFLEWLMTQHRTEKSFFTNARLAADRLKGEAKQTAS